MITNLIGGTYVSKRGFTLLRAMENKCNTIFSDYKSFFLMAEMQTKHILEIA